jgi:hypothetical protein
VSAILATLQMVLNGPISFRGCSAIVGLLQSFLPQFDSVPAPNTVQWWLLRLGLHELQRPKEKADDWIILVDHTIQLGRWKCLLIVGIQRSVWEKLDGPLMHEHLTVLLLEPVEKSDGRQVDRQLETVVEMVGVPQAILSDEGSDLVNGANLFKQQHRETHVLNDIAHKAAVVLKHELSDDPHWDAFLKHCGQTQPKVKQTELGNLAPPTLKVKARYMNLGPLIAWGQKMLRLVDTPATERPEKLDLSRLDEKFGWIRDYRESLVNWTDVNHVINTVLEYARIEGYHTQAAAELRERLGLIAHTAAGQRVANSLIDFVEQQSRDIKSGESLPASSEVLESLIGKGKRLQGQHSRGGFTKMILGMAASVVTLTSERVKEALETIGTLDLREWCNEHLGASLTAQRRQALPAITEQK